MTTLIQQRSDNDCVLASIAMAVGAGKWEDVWTDEDLQSAIDSQGISDYEPWLKRVGLVNYEDYRVVYTHTGASDTHVLLWGRRALLSVRSLNNDGGYHMVYFDGEKLHDPQEGVEGKLAYRFLHSCQIARAILLKGAK